MAERYGCDLRGGAFAAFVIVFPMFVVVTIIMAMVIMIVAVLVVVVNVYGMTVMTIAKGQRFQRFVVFIVVGVARVHRMKGSIPLSVIILIRYRNRLRNFGRDEELLLFKILSTFVQLWRHRSRRSVFRWRWYPMK
jgi:hypothetical protein